MINDQVIRDLAVRIFSSTDTAEEGRLNYLRTLVTAVQEQIAGKRGLPKLDQLEALSTVHVRFYGLIQEAAEAHLPKGIKGRGVELNRRTNFARTSLYALRRHVAAGGDVALLKASTVTKGKLRTPEPKKAAPVRVLERKAGRLMAELDAFAKRDRDGAILSMQSIIDALGGKMAALGVKSLPGAIADARAALGKNGDKRPGASAHLN